MATVRDGGLRHRRPVGRCGRAGNRRSVDVSTPAQHAADQLADGVIGEFLIGISDGIAETIKQLSGRTPA